MNPLRRKVEALFDALNTSKDTIVTMRSLNQIGLNFYAFSTQAQHAPLKFGEPLLHIGEFVMDVALNVAQSIIKASHPFNDQIFNVFGHRNLINRSYEAQNTTLIRLRKTANTLTTAYFPVYLPLAAVNPAAGIGVLEMLADTPP